MELILDRKYKKLEYTIGNLYIVENGKPMFFSNTIEDTDRGLTQSMSIEQIKSIKKKSITAIPKGHYEITLNVVSPKYSKKSQWVTYCNAKMPRLLNVPGFDGILIHPGNSAKDSDGCILPGKNDKKGLVSNSTETFKKLYTKMKEAVKMGEKLYITIK